MIGLRDDILRGDYRALYLAWLKTLEMENLLDSVTEPPVPPGLNKLSPALRTFVDFFEIDEFLIRLAAEASSDRETASEGWLRCAIALLPKGGTRRFSATPGSGRSAPFSRAESAIAPGCAHARAGAATSTHGGAASERSRRATRAREETFRQRLNHIYEQYLGDPPCSASCTTQACTEPRFAPSSAKPNARRSISSKRCYTGHFGGSCRDEKERSSHTTGNL